MLLTLALLTTLPHAAAMEVRSGDIVTVGPDEVISGDLYAAGSTIRIQGIVSGDVLAVGQDIDVSGVVGGDLQAAGESVTISGRVSDDARLVGGMTRLAGSAAVGGDCVAGGGSMETEPRTRIGGDLALGVGRGALSGVVAGDLRAQAGALRIDGEVSGDADVTIQPAASNNAFTESDAGGLVLGPAARINGHLDYVAPQKATFEPGARAQRATYNPSAGAVSGPMMHMVRRYLGLLFAGVLMLWIAPGVLQRGAEAVRVHPLRSLGLGIGAAIAWPIAGALLFIAATIGTTITGVLTLGGLLPLAVAGSVGLGLTWVGAALIAVGWMAQVVVAVAIGKQITKGRFLSLVIGLLVFVLARQIPAIGPVIGVGVAVVGLGALFLGTSQPEHRGELPSARASGIPAAAR
jgi:cytoskeletal protein CcmA (bactofilin family)